MIVLILLWIVLITFFSVFGSWYVRKYNRPDALVGLYAAFITISNVIAVKIAEFDLGFAKFYAPAATLVFAVTFLLTDIVNEKFGRKETHKMIFIAFLAQVATTFFVYLAFISPPAPFWSNQQSFELLFGLVPRIVFASWVAFLI